MNRALAASLLALALAVPAPLAGCGAEEETEAHEGEPIELGELSYNVQITRFLNPHDPEDAAYLRGQPPAPAGRQYLAVFMEVVNEGSEPARVAAEMRVVDTREESYGPLPSESEYALPLGATLPAGEVLPAPGTTAATGPIKGGMVLFGVDELITENRPVELEIPGPSGEDGVIELDI